MSFSDNFSNFIQLPISDQRLFKQWTAITKHNGRLYLDRLNEQVARMQTHASFQNNTTNQITPQNPPFLYPAMEQPQDLYQAPCDNPIGMPTAPYQPPPAIMFSQPSPYGQTPAAQQPNLKPVTDCAFSGWKKETDECSFTSGKLILSPWLKVGDTVLLHGDGDLTKFALRLGTTLAWNSSMLQMTTPWETKDLWQSDTLRNVFYLKAEHYDNFEFELQRIEPPREIAALRVPQHNMGEVQAYPGENVPAGNFYWIKVSPSRKPWACKNNTSVFPEELKRFEKERLRLPDLNNLPVSVVIFDGFLEQTDFHSHARKALEQMLKTLRTQGIASVFTARHIPTEEITAETWSHILKLEKLHNPKASVCQRLSFQKSAHLNLRYTCSYCIQTTENLCWVVSGVDPYEQLKPQITAWVNAGKTAKEIIAVLQSTGQQLSLPMLAKLKRQWNLRTYKESVKPRRRKRRGVNPPAADKR